MISNVAFAKDAIIRWSINIPMTEEMVIESNEKIKSNPVLAKYGLLNLEEMKKYNQIISQEERTKSINKVNEILTNRYTKLGYNVIDVQYVTGVPDGFTPVFSTMEFLNEYNSEISRVKSTLNKYNADVYIMLDYADYNVSNLLFDTGGPSIAITSSRIGNMITGHVQIFKGHTDVYALMYENLYSYMYDLSTPDVVYLYRVGVYSRKVGDKKSYKDKIDFMDYMLGAYQSKSRYIKLEVTNNG